MGLYHNTVDNGFMNTTNVIAENSLAPGSPAFPDNVQWSYNEEDARRLRHMPDIYVRPGGVPFGTSYGSTPISPADLEVEMEGLSLRVTPVLESVPLGAPVRVNIELVNTTTEPIYAPKNLRMKSGLVKGQVVGPAGSARTFSPLMLCLEDEAVAPLNPGERISDSLTLLRGAQGALFAAPGAHRITVDVHWDNGGLVATVTGTADVLITSTVDEAHAQAALKVLSTPDALLTLALGGDHLPEGIEAIQTALNNPVLRPHYAYIEAKRVARRFRDRKADFKAAANLIEPSTVMSPAEIRKAYAFAEDGGRDSAAGKAILKSLKANAGTRKFSKDQTIAEPVDSQ